MNAKVSFAVAGFTCFALTGLAAQSVEDRLAALEKRVASIYAKQGKTSEAEKLKDEIRTQFPEAVTHKGRPMKDAL